MSVLELLKPLNCVKCIEYFVQNPYILEACASVGIERGKSSAEMLTIFMEEHHKREHVRPRKRKAKARDE